MSFRLLRSTAAFLIGAGFLVVLVPLDAGDFRSVLARGWHGPRLSVRTTGTLLLGWWMSSVGRMLRVADARDRWGRLPYFTSLLHSRAWAWASSVCRAGRLGV